MPHSRAAPYDSRAIDKKRNDDYAPIGGGGKARDTYASRGGGGGDTFKRPVAHYTKRDDPPARGSSSYDRGSVVASSKDRYNSGSGLAGGSDGRSGGGGSSFVSGSSGRGGGASSGSGSGRDDRLDAR